MDVTFYQLTTTPLEKTLPKILEKAYSQNQRGVIVFDSEERLKAINASLWTYSKASFLPHGSIFDGVEFKDEQPFWLTCVVENPNHSSFIIITDGRMVETNEFSRCLDIFDGNDPEQLAQAKDRFIQYQQMDHSCTTWQQNLDGGWQKSDLLAT